MIRDAWNYHGKLAALLRFAADQYIPTQCIQHFLTGRQTNAGAVILFLTVQTFEGLKYFLSVGHIKTNAVVTDGNQVLMGLA